MHNFKTLRVWNESITLATDIHLITKFFPKEEMYGLRSQITRCCVSIPSNIAEGAGRDSDKEFLHFLTIAVGSSFELETQITIAKNLNYLAAENFDELLIKLIAIQKKLHRLKQKIKDKSVNTKDIVNIAQTNT
jgi:four helix bundle protein